MAMWRLAERRGAGPESSPWFFVMLVRHLGDSCFVAERRGRVLAYLVASVRHGGEVVHVFDLAFDAALAGEEQYMILAELLRVPRFRKARTIEFSPGCDVELQDTDGAAAVTAPLAKCRPPRRPHRDEPRRVAGGVR